MKKQWQLLDADSHLVGHLTHDLDISPLMARLLVNRGIGTTDQALPFLTPSLNRLTPPWKLAGMDAAVMRIHRALTKDEKIIVFGDYDADGITATAVLVSFLRQCGARVDYTIPHRLTDGYGMGVRFIRKRAAPAGVGLIITADCGSSSQEAVTEARRAGIHTIVTDHHPVDQPLEDALAVINPARSDCSANLAHLAGVGVAFYLIIGLRAHLREIGHWRRRREPNLKGLCDLVALGTVADVVPLIAENRILTAAGLEQINQTTRPGIAALIRMTTPPGRSIDTHAIAFKLAPRLNAAGRLVHARMACELLLTQNRRKATRLARTLCRLNSRRQTMEKDLLDAILASLPHAPSHHDQAALVIEGHRWHEGIVGIVASRLTRRFNRPAVVITTHDGQSKGSARSIDGIDLSAALNKCADLLDRFGGHALAAGFSLKAARVAAFKRRLETVMDELAANQAIHPQLIIDARVPLAEITPAMMDDLDRLSPYGQGNPYPLFMATAVRVDAVKAVGDRHRQLVLHSGSGSGVKHRAIAFNVTDDPPGTNRYEKIAYRPQWNYWNGRKEIQLIIEDAVAEVGPA